MQEHSGFLMFACDDGWNVFARKRPIIANKIQPHIGVPLRHVRKGADQIGHMAAVENRSDVEDACGRRPWGSRSWARVLNAGTNDVDLLGGNAEHLNQLALRKLRKRRDGASD